MGKSSGGGGGGGTTTVQPPRPNIPNEDLLMGSGLWRIHASSPYYSSPWRTMDFLQGYQAPSIQMPNFTGMNAFGQQPYGMNGQNVGQMGMPVTPQQMPGMGMWGMPQQFGFGMPMQSPWAAPPPVGNAAPGVGPGSMTQSPILENLGGAGPRSSTPVRTADQPQPKPQEA